MQTHTISSDSWHYKFIDRFKSIQGYDRPRDICEYRRWFINAFFRMIFIYGLITLFLLLPLTITGVWAYSCHKVGVWDLRLLPPPVVLFWFFVFCGLIFMVWMSVSYMYEAWCEKHPKKRVVTRARKTGTVSLMYSAVKEKFCVKVEFE